MAGVKKMNGIDRTYLELNYNEIGYMASYVQFAIDALRKGKMDDFEAKLFDESIILCKFLKTGYDANNREQISVSELGPYKLVRPVVGIKSSPIRDLLKRTDEVLEILNRAKGNVLHNKITAREHELLSNFFCEIADIYLNLARKMVNEHLRS
jgi:hypothetical protein